MFGISGDSLDGMLDLLKEVESIAHLVVLLILLEVLVDFPEEVGLIVGRFRHDLNMLVVLGGTGYIIGL